MMKKLLLLLALLPALTWAQVQPTVDSTPATLTNKSISNATNTLTFPATITSAPTSNVSGIVVTGANGGSTYTTHNVAAQITGGNNGYDVGLEIIKALHGYAGMEFWDQNQGNSFDNWINFLSSSNSTYATAQLNAYFSNAGTLYTRTGIIDSGHFSGSGNIDSTITPPTLDTTMMSFWNDIAGPSIQARTNSGSPGGYIFSALDQFANYTWAMEDSGDLQWGAPGANTSYMASIAGTVMTVTVAPTGGALAVGQVIQCIGCTANTVITSLGTGTGGIGTYNLSNSLTISPAESIYSMDMVVGRDGPALFRHGLPANANPTAQKIGFQNGAGTNIAAVNATIIAPLGTGTGTNGSLIFNTGVKTTTGTGAPTQDAALTLQAEDKPILIGHGGLSLAQETFTPNSGTTNGFGEANGGGSLILFGGTSQGLALSQNAFTLNSAAVILWTNSSSNTQTTTDLEFSRLSAGVGSVDTTSTGNSLGKMKMGGIAFVGAAPVVSACGTSPAIDANASNYSGTVTVGTVAAASCTVTFANSGFATFNHCRVTSQSTIASFAYSYTKTVLTVTGTSLVGDLFDYQCDGL